MKIYWSYKDVPELAGLSPSERRRVRRACNWRAFRSVRCLTAFLICILCGGIGYALGRSWGGGIGVGIGAFIYIQVAIAYVRPFYADYIKTELRRDVA